MLTIERKEFNDPINEGTSRSVAVQIVREDGVTGFRPDTITLTHYAQVGGTVIRGPVDIRSLFDTSGRATLTLLATDNVVTDRTATREAHITLIEWAWDGGASKGNWEILTQVRDLAKV